ncbi:MAG: L-seryl-tRNA(Sec) selenium transferase [Deltaproteobacteria bacterium]|mgnify:CR=1 FL=1|nr:L-seryl-tRNA(Sec) selenium transferase [Deltaproteobacteria bacterium]
MADAQIQSLLKKIPAVDRLLDEPSIMALLSRAPRDLVTGAVRDVLAEIREKTIHNGRSPEEKLDPPNLALKAVRLAESRLRPSLRRVVNATGTLIHTNLGRAPLSAAALRAIADIAVSYSNLEYDLQLGQRGKRHTHVEELLCRLTGAEAATVVNNNAGATLLALGALAAGKEAIVSRGELVEIGGSFRMPEVMATGGVVMREVGTTNKTHLRDYCQAIGPETALLLKVHTSNYRIVGFTEQVSSTDLVRLGRQKGIPVMEDLGSGMLLDLSCYGLPREPTVRETVEAGIDILTFSGDKLLGGPQAGIILGRREAVERIRHHPLARALRIDKLTLAGLEATLRHYLDREEALREIPILRMLAMAPEKTREKSERLLALVQKRGWDFQAEVIPESSRVGGGALPLTELPGFAVAVTPLGMSTALLAQRLRAAAPPVIGRIQENRLLFNPRTLAEGEEELVAASLNQVLGHKSPEENHQD